MIKQNHDDCDFRISLDRSEFMADKGFQYHIHQGLFEVLYCLEGDVECKIAGIVYPFPPHTLLIVKPEIPHATYVHSNQPYVRYPSQDIIDIGICGSDGNGSSAD